MVYFSKTDGLPSVYAKVVFLPGHRSDESGDDDRSLWPVKVGLPALATMKITDLRRPLKGATNKCFLSTDRLLQFESVNVGITRNRKLVKLR